MHNPLFTMLNIILSKIFIPLYSFNALGYSCHPELVLGTSYPSHLFCLNVYVSAKNVLFNVAKLSGGLRYKLLSSVVLKRVCIFVCSKCWHDLKAPEQLLNQHRFLLNALQNCAGRHEVLHV